MFPFWAFFVLANVLYWASWFEAGAFAVPLFFLLVLGAVSAPSWWAAMLIGAIFFLMLGAKELTFIHRVRAYELLVIALCFLGALHLGTLAPELRQAAVPLAYFVPGIALFLLREGASRYEDTQGLEKPLRRFLRSALGGLLLWEYGSVLSGLPLEGSAKSAALFAGAVTLFFLSARRAHEDGAYVRKCVGFSLAAVAIVFISTNWTL